MQLIHHCLDNIPMDTIRKYFRKVRLFEDAYRAGATSDNVLERVKLLKQTKISHRVAPKWIAPLLSININFVKLNWYCYGECSQNDRSSECHLFWFMCISCWEICNTKNETYKFKKL